MPVKYTLIEQSTIIKHLYLTRDPHTMYSGKLYQTASDSTEFSYLL